MHFSLLHNSTRLYLYISIMYPRFARLAIGTSASQVGKKLALVTAAGAFAYSYASECKNDVLYFTPRK